jgi:hypothetical protein
MFDGRHPTQGAYCDVGTLMAFRRMEDLPML